jgi:F-actin capping protein alpha subunit
MTDPGDFCAKHPKSLIDRSPYVIMRRNKFFSFFELKRPISTNDRGRPTPTRRVSPLLWKSSSNDRNHTDHTFFERRDFSHFCVPTKGIFFSSKMTEVEAVQTILRAAAPGHLDAVAEQLQKIAPNVFSKTESSCPVWKDIQSEQKKLQCLVVDTTTTENSPPNNHPLVGPLTVKLQQYQQQNFGGKQGVASRMAMTSVDGSKILIHTYAEKLDAPNKISGYWKATWTITNAITDTAVISGRVQIHSYAYEEGNAQLTVDKAFSSQSLSKLALRKGDEPTLVQAIMKQITEWELQVLGLLAAMNEGGTGEHLKSIRRVLPITKTKMKWDVVAQRSVKTLIKTAPQAKSKVSYGSS